MNKWNSSYFSSTSSSISPITMIKLALEIPLEILSLKGPDGITLLFPKPCSLLITIIEKSFVMLDFETHHPLVVQSYLFFLCQYEIYFYLSQSM